VRAHANAVSCARARARINTANAPVRVVVAKNTQAKYTQAQLPRPLLLKQRVSLNSTLHGSRGLGQLCSKTKADSACRQGGIMWGEQGEEKEEEERVSSGGSSLLKTPYDLVKIKMQCFK
jgi:hypothetical protein